MSNELNLNDLQSAVGGSGKSSVRLHLVQPGDTLTSIANLYDTTADALFALNKAAIISEANSRGLHFTNERDYRDHIFPGMALILR